LQRLFLDDDLDNRFGILRGQPHHPYHPGFALTQHHQRIDHQPGEGTVAKVDRFMYRRRHTAGKNEFGAAAMHVDSISADMGEQFLPQTVADQPLGREVEGQNSKVAGAQPFVQPGETEPGDRRHKDQDFGDHHEQDGQQQQSRGQAPRASCK
jgi:hypothetical protein